MKFYLSCLIVAVVFSAAEGSNATNTTTPTATAQKVTILKVSSSPQVTATSLATTSRGTPRPSSTVSSNSSPVAPASSSSVSPTNSSCVNHTSAFSPNMTSNINQTVTQVPSTGTVVTPSPSPSAAPSPGPTPDDKHDDDHDYEGMKQRMWVAASFAIIFAFTTVILAYLVCRQRRINQELQGDPATSRLL